jgi:hypothetical protein
MAEQKRSEPMRLARIRVLAANQGDRRAKLEEIIEIANDLLKEYGPKPRKERGGRDRNETGGRDRGNT